jgi:hypothetical protein
MSNDNKMQEVESAFCNLSPTMQEDPNIANATTASHGHTVHGNTCCWLCTFQVDEEAKRLMEFIVRSVGYIDIQNVSSQVSVFIHTRFKDAVDSDGAPIQLEGASPQDVETHIRKHVLHPKIRICVLIQELLEFQDHLRKNLVIEDSMTGMTAVDKVCTVQCSLTPVYNHKQFPTDSSNT